MTHYRILYCVFLSILFIIMLTGCKTVKEIPLTGEPWKQSDLRILELPGQIEPAFDLVAAYARETQSDIELRFDLLGSPDPYAYELILLLDTQPGGSSETPWGDPAVLEWDLAVWLPGRGMPHALASDRTLSPLRPRSIRLNVQDAVIVRLNKTDLAGNSPLDIQNIRVFASVRLPGETGPVDSIESFAFNSPAVDRQAPLLISFWDALPSATPAQALRRWDGAHTGPFGQRHGLAVLLDAAKNNEVSVAVLDLKRSDQLAALEALGGLDLVRGMQQDKLLLIPDLAYGDPWIASGTVQASAQAGKEYQVSPSSYLYGAVQPNFSQQYQVAFARMADTTHIFQQGSQRLIPLPADTMLEAQVDQQGLTTTSRSALLHAAISEDPGDLVVLGGSLPSSPWGDSLIAAPSFAYISGHPWIHVLDQETLLKIPAKPGQPECVDYLCASPAETEQRAALREGLENLPDGLFTGLAWQTFRNLTQAVDDPQLLALREAYLGQIWRLIFAAGWEGGPAPASGCTQDLDRDGNVDCVLATEDVLLILNPQGGRLVFAAARQENQVYQMVGPRSQLVTGLGDPLEWQPNAGAAADPQEIPGALGDSINDTQIYRYDFSPGQITFTHPDNQTQKTYRLIENGWTAQVEPSHSTGFQIPLLLVSSAEWKPGVLSSYRASKGDVSGDWVWSIGDEASIHIRVSGVSSSLESFSESLPYLSRSEDPNAEYSHGWYLPFPLAVINITAEDPFTVEMMLQASR